MMDTNTLNLIFGNKKKLCCCNEETIKPLVEGIAVRVGVHTDKALNGLVAPIDPEIMMKIIAEYEKAKTALLKIQSFLD
jgi:hypothetical protein